MSDYSDGTFFQTHPLFLAQEYAVQLMIYYDQEYIMGGESV